MASLCIFHSLCTPAMARDTLLATPALMAHAGATLALWVTLHGLRYHRVRALLLLRSVAWLLWAVPLPTTAGEWTGPHPWKSGAALSVAVAVGTGMVCRAVEQRARAVFSQEWVQAGVPRRVG